MAIKPAQKQPRTARAIRTARRPAAPRPAQTTNAELVVQVRQRLGVTRKVLSRMTGFSERAIADWDGGKPVSQAAVRKLKELERFQAQLAEVVNAGTIPEWLQTPNDAFDGLMPLEVMERGQMDRLWRMIFFLESGVPS
jgi:DNA-binding transcriptional regulator YiaG